MNHPIVKVTNVEIVGRYILDITFSDGQKLTINFEPVLYGHYYKPLRDLSLFNQVRVDPIAHTLVWPNGADFDPATLYNWHKGDGEDLTKRAQKWKNLDAKQSTKNHVSE